eukprot:scaffold6024_cov36-Attheya_sp.AAC.2
MQVGQYCAMTKLDPAMPKKRRWKDRPKAELTKPVQAAGIADSMRTTPMGMRAPYLSQRDPTRNLVMMVVTSEQMLDVHTSLVDKSRSSRISDSSGETQNQTVKARKREIQAQCRALM